MTATPEEVLDFVIRHRPGLSERELAEAIYGAPGYRQQIDRDCAQLVERHLVQRRPRGDGVNAYYALVATPSELGR